MSGMYIWHWYSLYSCANSFHAKRTISNDVSSQCQIIHGGLLWKKKKRAHRSMIDHSWCLPYPAKNASENANATGRIICKIYTMVSKTPCKQILISSNHGKGSECGRFLSLLGLTTPGVRTLCRNATTTSFSCTPCPLKCFLVAFARSSLLWRL